MRIHRLKFLSIHYNYSKHLRVRNQPGPGKLANGLDLLAEICQPNIQKYKNLV